MGTEASAPVVDADLLRDDVHRYIVVLVGMDGKPVHGRAKLQTVLLLLAEGIPKVGMELRYSAHKSGP
ncbi:MAG: hypothetical protein MPI95_01110 [Nitrosopumilus sp.]|nr:hypothetical protein [Nitrosopumilus sp.]